MEKPLMDGWLRLLVLTARAVRHPHALALPLVDAAAADLPPLSAAVGVPAAAYPARRI